MQRGTQIGLLLATAALLSGCLGSSVSECASSGRICRDGLTCVDALDECVSPDRIDACRRAADDDPCVAQGISSGRCQFGVCIPNCGDGMHDSVEQCDGSLLDEMTCTDFGFYAGQLGCSATCTFDTTGCSETCGDGKINGDELCDTAPPLTECQSFSFDYGTTSCSSGCGVDVASCGYIGWYREYSPGTNVYAGWAADSDTVYVVGAGGRVFKRLRTGWLPIDTGTTSNLLSIWGFGENDLFVGAGDGSILRWNGSTWSVGTVRTGLSVSELWGTSNTNVYAVLGHPFWSTRQRQLVRWDGAEWLTVTIPGFTGNVTNVRGSSATNVFVTANQPSTISRYDGDQWMTQTFPQYDAMIDVWAVSNTEAYALATDTLLRWDGSTWTEVASVEGGTRVVANGRQNVVVIGYSATNKRFVSYHYRGTPDVEVVVTPDDLLRPFPVGPKLVMSLSGSSILGFEGSHWVPPFKLSSEPMLSVWRSPQGTTWAVGNMGMVASHDGTAWSTSSESALTFTDISGVSDTDIWVSADSLAFHFDGFTWTQNVLPVFSSVNSVRAFATDDVYAAGGRSVIHYDGIDWTAIAEALPIGTKLTEIWGASTNDVWIIGLLDVYRGTLLDFSRLDDPILENGGWQGIGGTSADSVWLGGAQGRLLYYNGSSFTEHRLPTGAAINSIHGERADDMFATTTAGELYHYDGQRWAPVRSSTDDNQWNDVLVVEGAVTIISRAGAAYRLQRLNGWGCQLGDVETDCDDGRDNDCDGLFDQADSDCP